MRSSSSNPMPDISVTLSAMGGMAAVALPFVYWFGGKMDRLSSAIEHLATRDVDHEARLRVLESSQRNIPC